MAPRYRYTPFFKYDDGEFYIGTWVPDDIPPHPTDTLYVLQEHEVGRPDILSYVFYKNPNLYWIILSVNDLADPFEDMKPGMLIRIPQLSRVLTWNVKIK